MLHDALERLAREYIYERAKDFAGNELASFTRHEIPKEAKKLLIYLPFDLKIKGSVGAGNWAAVPWVGFFDPLITTSATKGFYVVYLVNAQTEDIYLSLNQGTTAVYQEFGEARGREILRRRALDIRERLPEYAARFDTSPINLGSPEALPAGYEAGHSFGRRYQSGSMSEEQFYADFEMILYAYEALINRGGTTPTETMIEESGTSDIEETRKYVLARRIERSSRVRLEVITRRSNVCEACGMDPSIHYNYDGRPENTPLDVHHAKPLRELAEGETRRYKIPDDFYVLCPNCHRMIHKQHDPSDFQELLRKVSFRYSRKT